MLYLVIAAVCCVLDQLLKYWTVATLEIGEMMGFVPKILSLTHVHNTGMAFSMLSEHTWLLAVVSVVVSVILVILILGKEFVGREKVCLSMILGGAIGNGIDRIFLGYVVDMFHLDFVDFAVFNLADSFINVGAFLLVILYIIRVTKEEKKKKGAMPELQRLKDKAAGGGKDESENSDDADNSQ